MSAIYHDPNTLKSYLMLRYLPKIREDPFLLILDVAYKYNFNFKIL